MIDPGRGCQLPPTQRQRGREGRRGREGEGEITLGEVSRWRNEALIVVEPRALDDLLEVAHGGRVVDDSLNHGERVSIEGRQRERQTMESLTLIHRPSILSVSS